MKKFIFSAVVIAALYFGYQFFTGKNSVMPKPYDCDTELAQISALCLMFKGDSCNDAELFVKEFLPKLGDVATIKRSLIKLDSSSKSSVCGIDINYDLSANSLDEARKKFESYNYVGENITNYGMRIFFAMQNDGFNTRQQKQSFDERFKSLDDYKKFLEQREASQKMMAMFGGVNLNRFYYQLFDNGKGEIWTQTSFNLEELR